MMRPLLLGLSGVLLATCLAEGLLRFLPVSTGYDVGSVDAEHPVLRGSPYFHYTYSKDWNFHLENSGTLNNAGFRASYDYAPDPRSLALIGNSFVEADAVEPKKNMGERLGALLGRPVYALGADGSSLADYLTAARWGNDTFGSRVSLVLLTTGDLSHSCRPQSGKHYLTFTEGQITMTSSDRAPPSRAKKILNGSRLFRYLFDNLRIAPNWSKGWRRDDPDPAVDAEAETRVGCAGPAFERSATEFLLKSFRDLETSRQLRVIFVLAPGYRTEQHVAAGTARDIDAFAQQAEQQGFQVVHLAAAFADALRAGVRLDFLPIDGHWSAAANDIAAKVTAGQIAANLP